MHITARVDCAVRALVELAAASSESSDLVKADAVSAAQSLPYKFLESVFADLRRAGLVTSRRGPDGGFRLARPADDITIADVIRAVEGPLASVRGERPEDVAYDGAAEPLQRVWIAVRVNLRAVLEGVTIAEVAAGALPEFVDELTADPGAWHRRRP
ncbi:Rrf2 family transcriptional regulator [Prescottella sp. R16]|uniref:RrF2 family transcriptional regulator n=1 Tax=Prescottella sp. R16 TaxID=3064529 RepID=UPI00272E9BBB|nr:Rrf2 family transcriptional regulator [Prescottella sp. R16]